MSQTSFPVCLYQLLACQVYSASGRKELRQLSAARPPRAESAVGGAYCCCRAAGRRQHGTWAGLASAVPPVSKGWAAPRASARASRISSKPQSLAAVLVAVGDEVFPSVAVAARSRPAPGNIEGQPPCRRKRGVNKKHICTLFYTPHLTPARNTAGRTLTGSHAGQEDARSNKF